MKNGVPASIDKLLNSNFYFGLKEGSTIFVEDKEDSTVLYFKNKFNEKGLNVWESWGKNLYSSNGFEPKYNLEKEDFFKTDANKFSLVFRSKDSFAIFKYDLIFNPEIFPEKLDSLFSISFEDYKKKREELRVCI